MSRPIKNIDVSLVEKLSAINCSMEEIASAVGCSRRTLQTRYCAVIEKGRSSGKVSLKRKMYEVAMNGNITMLIWLSKQMLGYTDKIEQTVEAETTAHVIYDTKFGDQKNS